MSLEEAFESTRTACLTLPSVFEKQSHGAPCWFVEKRGQFAAFVNDHHNDGRLALWLAGPQGLQESLMAENPGAFFRPPYVGARGWIGVRLDKDLLWEEVEGLIQLAHSTISAKRPR